MQNNDTREIVAQVQDAYVGRAADGGKLFLSLKVERLTLEAPRETTAHELVTGAHYWISIMGAYTAKGSRRHDFDGCGQNREDFAGAVADPKGSSWTLEDIRSALAIWDRWHLNGMKAGCEHVPEPVMEDEPYRRADLVNTPACPETGYRWGSKWLLEPVSADVVAEVERLASIPRGNVPAWLA